MKVKTRVRENFAAATEKPQERANALSPDLLRRMNAYWRPPTTCRLDRFIFTTIRC